MLSVDGSFGRGFDSRRLHHFYLAHYKPLIWKHPAREASVDCVAAAILFYLPDSMDTLWQGYERSSAWSQVWRRSDQEFTFHAPASPRDTRAPLFVGQVLD